MKQAQCVACRKKEPRQQHPGVNVAEEDAREQPGQDKKNLWVEHTIEKMAQQVHIISWVEVGKVVDLLGETCVVVNVMDYMLYMFKYSQEEVKNFEVKTEEVTIRGL